jgi:2,3-bisphosphoglycerate-independent phosphoglycerate mutase
MKYAIIIPDGASDDPLMELEGRTPLEAARTPSMDEIAASGRQGLVQTVPPGFESGSDVAIMCLLGYDPAKYHTGRAPLEAAAQKIPLVATDTVFRCNLVTVVEGIMKDHSAGGITDAEARQFISELAAAIRIEGVQFYPGVSYRNLMVYRGSNKIAVKTTPPHEIPEEPIAQYLPTGEGAEMLKMIMEVSRKLFEGHEINLVRRDNALNPASQVWFWGQGHAPDMPPFDKKFGVKNGCMITSVDLLRGLGTLLGWQNREVTGMTSYHDTNYKGQGEAAAAALDEFDMVVAHVEAPDEASHQADIRTKISSIEAIDKHVVGPMLKKLKTFEQWRILVLPDHPTNIRSRKHGNAPTPFCMAGTRVTSPRQFPTYNEKNAKLSDLKIERGHELMEYFLRHGMLG